jgi:hypothetical protein
MKSIFKITTLIFHLAASAHVISVEVVDPDKNDTRGKHIYSGS